MVPDSAVFLFFILNCVRHSSHTNLLVHSGIKSSRIQQVHIKISNSYSHNEILEVTAHVKALFLDLPMEEKQTPLVPPCHRGG